MESEKLNMTVVYHYWYKVWMEDSESWVYRDDTGELDVCCGENEVYDKVYEHLRTGAFAYPAIGLGFKIYDVNKGDNADEPKVYFVTVKCTFERDNSVEEWEEEVKVISAPYELYKVLEEYINDHIKTDDMENFNWTMENIGKWDVT